MGRLIVTLTANPSLDRTVALSEALRPGAVHRARAGREDAGGKGVNVARVVAAADAPTLAVVPVGADDPYRALLAETGVPHRIVTMSGRTRTNITVTDPAGLTTKLNLPGSPLTPSELDAVTSEIVRASEGAAWLVLAGSLPPGVDDDYYATVAGAVRAHHGEAAPRIALDASGGALRAAVALGSPDLIKPNHEELAELVDEDAAADVDVVDEAIRRARMLTARVAQVFVTLGADGALLVTADEVFRAGAPRIRVASTVGAGDSSLAGFLLADVAGLPPHERLRRGVAYGSAAATLPGTQAPAPRDLPDAEIPVAALATTNRSTN